jgi:uncharacterized membrane protein
MLESFTFDEFLEGDIMKKINKYVIIFLVFGILYYLIEVAVNGRSNWSSFLMSGIAGILINFVSRFYHCNTPKWKQIIISTLIIISIEFTFGLILKSFGIQFWDYSRNSMNIQGVICLKYSFYWLLLSPFAIQGSNLIEYICLHDKKPDKFIVYMKKLVSGE